MINPKFHKWNIDPPNQDLMEKILNLQYKSTIKNINNMIIDYDDKIKWKDQYDYDINSIVDSYDQLDSFKSKVYTKVLKKRDSSGNETEDIIYTLDKNNLYEEYEDITTFIINELIEGNVDEDGNPFVDFECGSNEYED